jgi:hypothetical protein
MSSVFVASQSAGCFFLRSHEQAKGECDWVVMTSVFVASQSGCFFLRVIDLFNLLKKKNLSINLFQSSVKSFQKNPEHQ